MNSITPLISVITVTYNAEATLPATLASIKSQDWDGEYEYIVQDGGSTDGTVVMAETSGIAGLSIESKPDKGLYDAMNRALDRAKGEYVIFLNAGDAFHGRDALRRYAEAIINNERPGIVYGQTILVDERRYKVGERHLRAPEELTYQSFSDGMVVCHQSMAVLKRISGFYDLRYRFSADYEWALRCLQHSRHNIYLGSEPVTEYLSEGLTTENEFASLRERFCIMCHYYGRRQTILRHVKFAFRGLKRKMRCRKSR